MSAGETLVVFFLFFIIAIICLIAFAIDHTPMIDRKHHSERMVEGGHVDELE